MPTRKHLIFGDRRDPREELAEVFNAPVPTSGGIQPEALSWAMETLDRAEVSGEVEAIRRVRQAEPRLGLRSATYLVRRALAKS